MKQKKETKSISQKHLKLVENDTRYIYTIKNRVEILRSDNGTEMLSEIKDIVEKHVMCHHTIDNCIHAEAERMR